MNTMQSDNLMRLTQWLQSHCALESVQIKPLVNDASFRQYFRVTSSNQSYVLMVAPPEKEDIRPFIAIAKTFLAQDIHVPKIFAYDLNLGFILLSDLGNNLYLDLLNQPEAETDKLYQQALTIIPRIQSCKPILFNDEPLALFDEQFIRSELNLFSEWFLIKHLGLTLSLKDQQAIEKNLQLIIDAALEQPQVCVHRDYHSRNILLVNEETVGVLDFQDAVYGPITYDAVSLLRDAYINWPEHQVERWALNFHHMLTPFHQISKQQFLYWFDLMGIQRHLKILGIFARLSYRDNKPQYLNSLNRLLQYLQQISKKYSKLNTLSHLFLHIQSILSEKQKK